MKRIRKLMGLLVVLTGTILQAQTIQMRIPDPTAVNGDVVSIPVYVDNTLTGLNVYSYQLVISYNSNVITANNVTVSGTMSSGWGNPVYNTSTPGILGIAHAGSTPLAGTGVLLYLNFTCTGTGGSSLIFNNGSTSNFFNEGTPVMVFDNGSINVTALPTISINPNTALLAVGETQQFTVSGGTAPYGWSLTNPATGNIGSSGLFTATGVGFTKVLVQDNNGILDETNGVVEVRAMKLTIPAVSEWQGGTVEIPINTTTLSGFNILAGEFRFTFSSNILTPTGYNSAGTMLQGNSNLILNTTVPGQVTFAFAGTAPLTGSGELIRLVFDVSSIYSGNTGLHFTYATFNETLAAKTVDGVFNMITLPNLSISPATYTIVAGQTKSFSVSGGIPPYTWTSTDPSVASIDNTGLLTAYKSGVIQLHVTDNVGATGNSGNISVYDTWVGVPTVNSTLGSVYDMPVSIGPIPAGQQIFSVQGTIGYDTPELTVVDIITTGTLCSGWTFVKNISGNTITFAGAGTAGIATQGVLFKLRFQLNPDLTNGEFAFVNFNNLMLNEGIPLPLLQNGGIIGTGGIVVDLKALLQGPFETSSMTTDLNPWFISQSQPYSNTPWFYTGSESFWVIPNASVTDWVLVELRQTTGAASTATPATMVGRKAALILSDGTITAVDGSSDLIFGFTPSANLYVVIWHRNHLAVMSSVPLTSNGGIYSYDFTTAASKAYLNGQVSLGGGKYGLYAGNADGNGTINATDITGKWDPSAGKSGYFGGDMNMDTQVNNPDKNNYWLPNNGIADKVPD
ncbi:MAG: Ig-like domain-containing protein [Bacteroidales bacterium]|nr:Ig-like domain-containing protein [Bacteroidales bacterium]